MHHGFWLSGESDKTMYRKIKHSWYIQSNMLMWKCNGQWWFYGGWMGKYRVLDILSYVPKQKIDLEQLETIFVNEINNVNAATNA